MLSGGSVSQCHAAVSRWLRHIEVYVYMYMYTYIIYIYYKALLRLYYGSIKALLRRIKSQVLELDVMFVPVCRNLHWTLAVLVRQSLFLLQVQKILAD
jgi:hypothetical protein